MFREVVALRRVSRVALSPVQGVVLVLPGATAHLDGGRSLVHTPYRQCTRCLRLWSPATL